MTATEPRRRLRINLGEQVDGVRRAPIQGPPASQAAGRAVIGPAGEVLVEQVLEHLLVRVGSGKSVIDERSFWASTWPSTSEASVAGNPVSKRVHWDQPRTQDRVCEVGLSLGQTGDGEVLRGRATAEAGDLLKHEPHPVATLAAVSFLAHRLVVGVPRMLCVHRHGRYRWRLE